MLLMPVVFTFCHKTIQFKLPTTKDVIFSLKILNLALIISFVYHKHELNRDILRDQIKLIFEEKESVNYC